MSNYIKNVKINLVNDIIKKVNSKKKYIRIRIPQAGWVTFYNDSDNYKLLIDILVNEVNNGFGE